ncbi:MAG TPA: M67 family metallopeptidase [Terriglobales bacterium]|nr:M67 family metallopeptidase [Terriglobales bacterium]
MDTLHLAPELAAQIEQHGIADYPHECCGALLGLDGAGGREVRRLFPLINRRDDSPRNRFAVTAGDVLAAERAARGAGLDILGWYHSHPDHPALPSEFDREHAWPWYSYVIVNTGAGYAGPMTSWRLAPDRSSFLPETLHAPHRALATVPPEEIPWP